MPVIINAVVTVTLVTLRNESTNLYQASIELMKEDDCDIPLVMILNAWQSDNICIPVCNGVYYVDGKLTFDTESGFIIEAIRLIEWNDSIHPVPARITCSGNVLEKSNMKLDVEISCYASKIANDIRVTCHFNQRQYKAFYESAQPNSLVHLSGWIKNVDEKRILHLNDTHFSYIEKMPIVKGMAKKEAPKWWNKKPNSCDSSESEQTVPMKMSKGQLSKRRKITDE